VSAYLSDLLADRFHLLERLVDDVADLLCDLALFFFLELLVGRAFVLFVGDVLEERDLAELVAVLVDDVAVVVDRLAHARQQVALGEPADDVAVLVAHFAFLVDAQARHGADFALFLLWLPALGVADHIAVL
jgi:hypothetical protein